MVKTVIIRPVVPVEAMKNCSPPSVVPDRRLSEAETFQGWNRDRVALQVCELRRAAAVAANRGVY